MGNKHKKNHNITESINNSRIIMQKNKIFSVSEYSKPVYGEKIIYYNGAYIREWNPKRSKLGAAIMKGMSSMPLNNDSNILYLGASTGTTVSHISDICFRGKIYAVEVSYDSFVKLFKLSEYRNNIYPILEDANLPEKYSFFVDEPEIIYQDIAQRNQIQIFNENVKKFSSIKYGFLIIKVKSISSKKSDRTILNSAMKEINGFKIKEIIDLRPYDSNNYLLCIER